MQTLRHKIANFQVPIFQKMLLASKLDMQSAKAGTLDEGYWLCSPGVLTAEGGNTDSRFYNFFMGRELNPRIGSFDIKHFVELYPNLVGWVLIDLGMVAKQQQVSKATLRKAMLWIDAGMFHKTDSAFIAIANFAYWTDLLGFCRDWDMPLQPCGWWLLSMPSMLWMVCGWSRLSWPPWISRRRVLALCWPLATLPGFLSPIACRLATWQIIQR